MEVIWNRGSFIFSFDGKLKREEKTTKRLMEPLSVSLDF